MMKAYKGYLYSIETDKNPVRPDDWDSGCVLVADHRQFYVQVEGFKGQDIADYVYGRRKIEKLEEELSHCKSSTRRKEIKEEVQEITDQICDFSGHYVYPLYAYIHSGVSLSLSRDGWPFNDRWDSGHVGFILVGKKNLKDNFPDANQDEKAFEWAEGCVEEWNQYLSGEVYGYRIFRVPEGTAIDDLDDIDEDDLNEEDSCWGVYGEESYCEGEAKAVIDYKVEQDIKNGAYQI